jgi:hypothetical protein
MPQLTADDLIVDNRYRVQYDTKTSRTEEFVGMLRDMTKSMGWLWSVWDIEDGKTVWLPYGDMYGGRDHQRGLRMTMPERFGGHRIGGRGGGRQDRAERQVVPAVRGGGAADSAEAEATGVGG